jgi:hypothetical protein
LSIAFFDFFGNIFYEPLEKGLFLIFGTLTANPALNAPPISPVGYAWKRPGLAAIPPAANAWPRVASVTKSVLIVTR